jgi:hypothetical protein
VSFDSGNDEESAPKNGHPRDCLAPHHRQVKWLFWLLKADGPVLKNKDPLIPRVIVPEFRRPGWPADVMRSMRNDFDLAQPFELSPLRSIGEILKKGSA